MDQIEVSEITGKLILVGVDVSSISGTITRDDRRDGDDKDVFTSGAVRYISPIVLRPFAAARQAAVRACRSRGTRFWGGWAVSEEALPELKLELERIAKFVNEKKEAVINNWERELAQWEGIHPAAATYRNRFPSRNMADKAIGIAVSAVKIAPTGNVILGADDAVSQEVFGMPRRILEEIASDVRDSWKPGAQKATQAIKGLLGRIRDKCSSLSFVGGNLADVAAFVDRSILSLPQSGDITGNDFLRLSGILSLLEKPDLLAAGDFSFQVKIEEEVTEAPVASTPENVVEQNHSEAEDARSTYAF